LLFLISGTFNLYLLFELLELLFVIDVLILGVDFLDLLAEAYLLFDGM